MKALGVILIAVVGLLGVIGLAGFTQNRPDEPRPGSRTVVEFDVSTRGYRGGEASAAQALWSVCVATIPGETSQPVVGGDGEFTVTVTPAIGEHGRKRLVGCLEDGTLDRVIGHVDGFTST